MDEIRPLHESCDVLFTAGAGPASRLADTLAAWPGPNVFAPFALLGVPALVCCAGFGVNGLPMSIQLVGRPFEDARLLGIAHAYERATGWSLRRPRVEDMTHPVPVMRTVPPPPVTDAAMFARCQAAVRHAGVPLSDAQISVLASNAVHLMAMTARVRDNVKAWQDPASVFVR